MARFATTVFGLAELFLGLCFSGFFRRPPVVVSRRKCEISVPVKKSEIVDFRPFKQKIIPLLPPKSHLRKLLEGEKGLIDKTEVTTRMFV